MNSKKRSQSGDGEPRGERQQPTKKKRVTKKMNTTTANMLRNPLLLSSLLMSKLVDSYSNRSADDSPLPIP